MKCTSRAQAVERYGHIDFEHKHWPDQMKWLKLLEIPPGWFPTWTVLDTGVTVRRIACNIDMHAPLMAALKAIHEQNLGHELHTFDGCFNIRAVRGSASASTHAYGLGLDIYAKKNLMSYVLRTTFSKAFVKCFTDQNFNWGGNWKGRKDPMHFSYAWE